MFSKKIPLAADGSSAMLERLEFAIRAGGVECRREGSGLVLPRGSHVTRVLITRSASSLSTTDPIQAIVKVVSELPRELQAILDQDRAMAMLNRMATLGGLYRDSGQVAVGSRLTVFERENAWDLQGPLVVMAAIRATPSLMGAMPAAVGATPRPAPQPSAWGARDFAQAASRLRTICVCDAGDDGISAEFGLEPGAKSAVAGDRNTALWQMTLTPHPEAGGGLFCLLQMPHVVNDEAKLDRAIGRLNSMEMEDGDAPPHFGAWCRSPSGNGPAYVSFLPNALYVPGIALNLSVWAQVRARLASERLAGMGIRMSVPETSASAPNSGPGIGLEEQTSDSSNNFDALVSLLATSIDRGPVVMRAVLLAAVRAGENPRAVYWAAVSRLSTGALPPYEVIAPRTE